LMSRGSPFLFNIADVFRHRHWRPCYIALL
jgi:hypothetical protein